MVILLTTLISLTSLGCVFATDYYQTDSIFDTSENIHISYSYIPAISSTDLPDWAYSLNNGTASWVYHLAQFQDDRFRFEIGYWVYPNNDQTYVIKLWGDDESGDVKCLSVMLPDLEMSAYDEYDFDIIKYGNVLSVFVNGEPYKGSTVVQVWYKNGSIDYYSCSVETKMVSDGKECASIDGVVLPCGFVLGEADSRGVWYNITGWDKYHVGSHPYASLEIKTLKGITIRDIIDAYSKLSSQNTMKAPIPIQVVILTLISIGGVILRHHRK
jgi:hypothetical protein